MWQYITALLAYRLGTKIGTTGDVEFKESMEAGRGSLMAKYLTGGYYMHAREVLSIIAQSPAKAEVTLRMAAAGYTGTKVMVCWERPGDGEMAYCFTGHGEDLDFLKVVEPYHKTLECEPVELTEGVLFDHYLRAIEDAPEMTYVPDFGPDFDVHQPQPLPHPLDYHLRTMEVKNPVFWAWKVRGALDGIFTIMTGGMQPDGTFDSRYVLYFKRGSP